MANNGVVKIENLSFRYPKADSACLDIQELHADAGDRIFIYGPVAAAKARCSAYWAACSHQNGERFPCSATN